MAEEPVAIVGMSVLLPGAADLAGYWHNLVNGVDSITAVPQHRLDPGFHDLAYTPDSPPEPDRTYCHRGGFLPESLTVDVGSFGIMPSSINGMEPDQLIALHVAANAVADAGGPDRLGDRQKIGVILGRGAYLAPGMVRFEQRVRTVRQITATLSELLPELDAQALAKVRGSLLESLGPMTADSTIGLVPNLAASRVANRMDLHGPAYTVDAACASSLLAVDAAVRELNSGRCDAVLAGGVHHCHDDTLWSMFSQLRALSTTEQIRPLAQDADGLLIGEGTGIVVLKRLADARRDGDRVYAVIRGVGVSSDGRAASLFNPDTGGQALALRRAWESAGLDPAAPGSIGMLEAHGTATKAGDAAELATVASVFGGPNGPSAVIGSVKSMIGHTMPAAGVAGLIKVALALHNATLLPTLHCDRPNETLEKTRFATIATAQPWEHDPASGPRRGAVNAFGFGGINAHVILEEEPAAAPVVVAEPERVLRLSASTSDELLRMLEHPHDNEPGTGPLRLGIVEPTEKRIALARKIVAAGKRFSGRNDVWYSPEPLLGNGSKTAYLFPGLEGDFEPNCADVAVHFGLPMPELSTTHVLRHAASVSGVSLLLVEAMARFGIRADSLAGHSVGEWTAMMASGMYQRERGRELVERCLEEGLDMPEVDFVVLGCGADDVLPLIEGRTDIVISHDNAPRQTIACGEPAAIEQLAQDLRAKAVIARILPFRSGFHTEFLKPYLAAFEKLSTDLGFRGPSMPVWSATTADLFPADPEQVRDLYLRHLVEPVRFREVIEAMYAAGHRVFVQAGPGQLGSFVTDTLGDRPHLVIGANSGRRAGMAQLRRLATAMWVEGAEPDFAALDVATAAPKAVVKKAPSIPVPVRLATPLLSMPAGLRELVAPAAVEPTPSVPIGAGAAVVAEFTKLLAETKAAAFSVLTTASSPAPVVTPAPTPAPAVLAPPVPRSASSFIDVSMTTMPYLVDHRFFRQRDGWPDESDWRPVVPATTVIEFAIREVLTAWPDRVAVAVHDALFKRWLIAAPAVRVPVTMERDGDRVSVRLGEYASMVVELGDRYPVPTRGPATPPPADAVPRMTAERVYGDREMFHGKLFQGVTRVHATGPWHAHAEITVLPAPGALLDNVGQVLGCWLLGTEEDGLLAFPRSIRRIAFFGPQPADGAKLDCLIQVRTPDSTLLDMTAELVQNGKLWAEIDAWQDVRFACDRRAHGAYAFPHLNGLAAPGPADSHIVTDRWPGVATRDIYAGIYLNAAERAEYARSDPRGQRHWLLGRIAVKDAVRAYLGESGIYPAELTVVSEGDGRARVRGEHGRQVPELAVSVACHGELAIAVVRPTAVGIDIQPAFASESAAKTAAMRASGSTDCVVNAIAADHAVVAVPGGEIVVDLHRVGEHVVALTR